MFALPSDLADWSWFSGDREMEEEEPTVKFLLRRRCSLLATLPVPKRVPEPRRALIYAIDGEDPWLEGPNSPEPGDGTGKLSWASCRQFSMGPGPDPERAMPPSVNEAGADMGGRSSSCGWDLALGRELEEPMSPKKLSSRRGG